MRPAAFDAAIVADQHKLFRAACGLTGKPHEAQDLVHDTIVRALRFADRFDSGDLHAWLFIIMRNEFITQRRNAWRTCEDPDEAQALLIEVPPPQESRIELRDTLDAIERLPPQFRDVMRLAALGYDPLEIADALGLPLGTAKSRLWRGRQMLAKGFYE